MRAPDQTFTDAIDAFLVRFNLPPLPKEAEFFARVRQCPGIPRARRANDYANLVDSLHTAWEVADVWPGGAELAQRKQEHATRQLAAIRTMRKAVVPFHWAIENWLESLERLYTEHLTELEPFEILCLEYARRDNLSIEDLGREHRNAGHKLFVREVSLAMRNIFGRPHDKIVGILAGLAFKTEALSHETVRAMRKTKPV